MVTLTETDRRSRSRRPMFKSLDVVANIRDLQARYGRPSIAQRRRAKRVRRLAEKTPSAPLTGAANLGASIAWEICKGEHETPSARPEADGQRTLESGKFDDDEFQPFIIGNLNPQLQCVLDSPRPLGVKLDEVKCQRYDVFDDKLPLLRLLDKEFPERSSYDISLLETSRKISGLIQILRDHCRAEQGQVLTAVRVATVVNIVVEESTIEIQNFWHTGADFFACTSDVQAYKLERLQDQLQLFVTGLGQKKLATLSRRAVHARGLKSSSAHLLDSPLDIMI